MSESSFDRRIKIISAAGVIAGIFFTGYQIRNAQQTAEARLVYEIQKDGRVLQGQIFENEAHVKCYLRDQPCSENDIVEGEKALRAFVQFMVAVYNQYVAGALKLKYWTIWRGELCRYLTLPRVSEYWKENSKFYSAKFNREVKKCEN